MTQEEMLTALYEKMAAEQDKYRDWLKGQPAAEVLNHAYEYTVREDIVMCMEELELTEAQAKALLASPAPLADIYKDFEKLETSYMDVIRDTIETRANELYQAQEKLKNTPLYPHSAAYASEHGEMAQYNASFQASHACMEAIEQAISRHYRNNRLDAEAAVNDVLEQFGPDRVQYVLANTVRHLSLIHIYISILTVQKAYGCLQDDGFIEITAGKGCYVSAQNQDFYLEEQQKRIEEKFAEAIEIARTSGISLDKLTELLTLMYQEDE